jgi:hypothetical protein
MSYVSHSAFAPMPSESNFEGLTKRLLALRAEIDAILAELVIQAMPRGEATVAPLAQEMSPAPSDPLTDGESMREGQAMVENAEAASGEDATDESLEPSQIVRVAAPEQPIADATALEAIEVEQEAREHAEQISDEPAPIAATETESEPTDGISQCLESETSPTADMPAATEAVSAEPAGDAAILDAPQHSSAESTQNEPDRHEPAALVDAGIAAADGAPTSDSPATAAADVGNVPADAAVISLHARQRKQKGELAIRAPRPVHSSRHLAAKIAACILVLLTAATILVMADRTAMGSVQSLPWMSPMPSAPAGTDQALQPDQRRAAQTSDGAEATADIPPLADGILMRYRDAWPSGS